MIEDAISGVTCAASSRLNKYARKAILMSYGYFELR
jgi:hypothetical protein